VGRGSDDACLNAFLAATLLRVVREAVHVQALASASVVPFAAVHGIDTGASGDIVAGDAGRVGEIAVACRDGVDVGAAAACSSAGGAASCQVMSLGPSGVVSSSLVEGVPASSNLPRPLLCQPHSTFTPFSSRHLRSLTAVNSVAFDLFVSCSSC